MSQLPNTIATAALRLVQKHGASGFSMGGLANEAGISRATLYRQVRSRTAVLRALQQRGIRVSTPSARERILVACRAVFSRAGLDAATLEDVAAEASVSAATVYRQFKDKEGLTRAFFLRFGPRRAVAEVMKKPSGDLRADLERAAEAVLRFAAENSDLLKLALIERARGGPWAAAFRDSPVRVHTTLTRLLTSYVAQGVLADERPESMARAFAGLIFTTVLAPVLEGEKMPDASSTAAFITRVFLDGVRRKP